MKPTGAPGKDWLKQRSRRSFYHKVLDNRKHPIRGLWRRNSSYIARITVEDEAGRRNLRWVTLTAATPAEAQEELRKLLVERSENRLRHVGRSPTFADFLDKTYLPLLPGTGKKPDTLTTEKAHYNRWREALGHLRLDKIRPSHILDALHKLRAVRAARTCNLATVCLRHVLKAAKRDGYLTTLPMEGVEWQRTEKKARSLFSREDIESVCGAASQSLFVGGRIAGPDERDQSSRRPLRNAQAFSDYLKFLAFSGAREQEALRTRWGDVDLDRRLLTIGAEGQTKNREARRVNINPALEEHLREMAGRRAPDSEWVFPSPQRGEVDVPARTFRESLKLAREAARLPHFGFHDCRHHFISMCVMSGLDFMTIARWVGHKDGGVLIGKVYGHLTNEHAQAQALRVSFVPKGGAAAGLAGAAG